ncbi:MAG: mercury transporter MerT [Gemmatimonadetes bacterium]|nr:mercury transporter MerT [Gemmatimonadota bacterium]
MIKIGAALGAGVAAALGASVCCIGPLLAVFVGIGGAGLSATFEPLRPYLLAASALFFVVVGIALHRSPRDATCSAPELCEPSRVGRNKGLFWASVGIAAVLASFPWWSKLLI